MVAELERQYEQLLVDDVNYVRVNIVVNDVNFPGNYYDYMMPANTDLGIGGISGSLLDAPGFLDVFSDDNRGGFNLNWGKDTTSALIEVEYINNTGYRVREIWGYNALVTALVEKVYVRDGVEQSAWTSAEALIAAYVDMAGEEVESSADGTALAETLEGKSMAELAEEAGVDTMHAFTVATVSGNNYLFLVAETFGEYTFHKQENISTSSQEAIVKYLEERGYTIIVVNATLLDNAGVVANEHLQNKYSVLVDSVARVLSEEDVTHPNAELYAASWELTYSGSYYSDEDAWILLNINGYYVVVKWL
jgi:hypothetical protein